MAPKRICTASQTLAFLNAIDDWDSDGGEELYFHAKSDSETESDVSLSSDATLSSGIGYSDSSEDEHWSAPRKRRVVAQDDHTPAARLNASDGTVWEKMDTESHGVCEHTPNVAFSKTPGPTRHAKRRITSRLQSFLCLIDMEMLRSITDCTIEEALRTEPIWSLSVSELMAFIGVMFLRATLCQFGAVVDAWSNKFTAPAIKATMSRDRYKDIMRHLRFDHKDTRTECLKTDRFAAMSDIWQRFVDNCILCYRPGRHVTVYEQLFPTDVSCPFLNRIARKPDQFGMRFWIAADLETKYMCNAVPCLGADLRDPARNVRSLVVTELMEPYLDKGRTVTTDDYFTSISLANILLKRNTTLLGTIQVIRPEVPPPAKLSKGRKEFSTEVYRSGSATLTVYAPRKNKSVCVLSTMHQHVTISRGYKQKPNTITDYNTSKCGVDVMDQKARMYTVCVATRRWPLAVFYNMLDMAVMNAHVLYKACSGSTEKRRDFMHSLAEELRSQFLQEKAMMRKKRYCQMRKRLKRVPSKQCKCMNDGPWFYCSC